MRTANGRTEAAFCGDYCGKCPNYPLKCAGCLPELHKDCRFIQCCLRQRIEHCGLCPTFPCEALREFVPDDRPGCPPGYHLENLRDRAAVGTEVWLKAQRAQWGRGRLPRSSGTRRERGR